MLIKEKTPSWDGCKCIVINKLLNKFRIFVNIVDKKYKEIFTEDILNYIYSGVQGLNGKKKFGNLSTLNIHGGSTKRQQYIDEIKKLKRLLKN